ncbi:putative transcription factor [Aspergillus brunneoviolaceus CBS 621.78]|uniref:Uncharacterized protein n=1 Tax=Aspergillus brunneoviolaceus CBS 621.78 TaxID=1450534 RepID=A0ACD1GJV6_9EURO|nr:hypothetical protein BO95DRAFT_405872 [Aspergillus brunneoviolaceus CBS 621.78]RAH49620.1 hypothetical protein BO95DRAFT_405872 [Aspergillus brunneoviolaceus CBS 621.78]
MSQDPLTSSAAIPPAKPRRRRDKPQFSCNACRQRKSRCDRQQPTCSSCLSRGQTCVYLTPRPGASSSSAPSSGTAGVHDRLVHLERLVKSLMADGVVSHHHHHHKPPQPLATPDSSSSGGIRQESASGLDTQSDCGSMQITSSELRYVAGEHWAAILDSIADLKAHCDREEQISLAETPTHLSEEEPPHFRHALLLYGCHRATSRAEIIAALPPKAAVDRYISRYFNYLDLVASAAVHGPSFLREASWHIRGLSYEAFWTDSSRVSIVWVGLLFSMVCLAVMASDTTDGPEAEQKSLQIDLYREKIVQCLVLGEYTKPGQYVLETVVHYLYIEFGINPDADRNIWFLLGLEVNLAMRMGYHRDPSHFSGISPLQGEMRRRLWATVLTSDILLSSQMGMPRMICDWKCDTAEPRNLYDMDLDQELTQLPPARPETEHTTALGIIARRRMIIALGAIADLADAVKPVSYAEIMQADKALHEAVASIPPPLRIKPLAASVTDSPQVIMSRLFLGHLLYKGQIMLHRRFLELHVAATASATATGAGDGAGAGENASEQASGEAPFAYSRTACIDASLGTLHIQHVLDEETCPGGQLHEMRWRITSSMNHLFLTATMILCSLLHRAQPLGERTEEVLAALRRARTIWMRRSTSSREAKRATEIVSLTLARAGDGNRSATSAEEDSEPMVVTQNASTVTSSDFTTGLGMTTWSHSMDLNEADRRMMPSMLGPYPPPQYTGMDYSFPMMDDWLQMQWLGPQEADPFFPG